MSEHYNKALELDEAIRDLEQAANDYVRRSVGPSVGTIGDRLRSAFLAGADWQAREIQKIAISNIRRNHD